MATQICPNCKEDAFTWFMDEDISPLMIWSCTSCNYNALEDDSKERLCHSCNHKTESLFKDNEKEFWWCSSCHQISKT